MKHAMTAGIALAVGLGLTVAAQANGNLRQSAVPNHHLRVAAAHRMHTALPGQTMNRQEIKQAQQQLKTDGLYNGPINGINGRSTRLALGRFQQQNGLPHTARLDNATRTRLMGNQEVGVGSSMPTNKTNPADNAGNGTNPAPIMPPATQVPSAGGNTGTPNPPNPPAASH